MKFVFNPDVILCGWRGSKHQLTNYSTHSWPRPEAVPVASSDQTGRMTTLDEGLSLEPCEPVWSGG